MTHRHGAVGSVCLTIYCLLSDLFSGISMTLLESKNGVQYFTFEHSRDYQQVQFKFLDAVKSMDPNNIVVKSPAPL